MIPLGNPYKAKYFKAIKTEDNQEIRPDTISVDFRYQKLTRTKTSSVVDNQELDLTTYLMTSNDSKIEEFKRNDYIEFSFNNKTILTRINIINTRNRADTFKNNKFIYDLTLIEANL